MASQPTIARMLVEARGTATQAEVVAAYVTRFPLDRGMNTQQLSNWERGRGRPNLMRIHQLAEVLPGFDVAAALDAWRHAKAAERAERAAKKQEAQREAEVAELIQSAGPSAPHTQGDAHATQGDQLQRDQSARDQGRQTGRRRQAQ